MKPHPLHWQTFEAREAQERRDRIAALAGIPLILIAYVCAILGIALSVGYVLSYGVVAGVVKTAEAIWSLLP